MQIDFIFRVDVLNEFLGEDVNFSIYSNDSKKLFCFNECI